jgi:hypothetical protein
VNGARNRGRAFETLTRGLPQEHAYDLVYRHALDVNETGDRLAFGSGDSWQTLSSLLPPIHAVRFEKTN